MSAWSRVLENSSVDDPVLRVKAQEAFSGARVDQIIVREGHTWAVHYIDGLYLVPFSPRIVSGSRVFIYIRPSKGDLWHVRTKVINRNYLGESSSKFLPEFELKGGAELGSYLVMLYMKYGVTSGSKIAEGFGALHGKMTLNDGEVIGASGHLHWEKGIVPRKVRKALGISWWNRHEDIKWSAVEDKEYGGLLWKLEYFGRQREMQGTLAYVSGRLSGTLSL